MRFDRMGAFAYSEEEGTYAAEAYEDSIPQEVKQARLDELMDIQQGISAELSAAKIGKQMKIIIDRLEGDYYIGRTDYICHSCCEMTFFCCEKSSKPLLVHCPVF